MYSYKGIPIARTDPKPPSSRDDAKEHCVDLGDLAEDSAPSVQDTSGHEAIREAISAKCDELKAFLLEKNTAYGNSVFEPCRVFAKGLTRRQQLCSRIDDKLNRIINGRDLPGDDNLLDFVCYGILLLTMDDLDQ